MNQKDLGRRIREERLKLNYTQENLAELSNVSSTYIGLVERGERTITLSKLIQIASILGVSVDYLLSDSLITKSSNQEKLLLQLFSSASEKEQALIIEMTKLIINHF